jgi:anti-repressor protein
MQDKNTSLIPITQSLIGGQGVPAVNARDLHAFLEVGSDFFHWINRRIDDFGFIEGQDFQSFLTESSGGRPAREYGLTLSMAKELAMVERNEKGKQARLYFIECEKKANDPIQRLMSMTRPEMLEMAAGLAREKAALACKVQEMEPKAEFHDRVAACNDGQSIGEVAKLIGTGQNRLFAWLRSEGILMGNNQPYQEYMDRGYFRLIEQTFETSNGFHVSTKTLVTGKGLAWLTRAFGGAA